MLLPRWLESGAASPRVAVAAAGRALAAIAVAFGVLVVAGLAVQRYVDVDALRSLVQSAGPLAPAAAVVAVAVRSLLFIPVLPLPVLVAIAVLLFGTLAGAAYVLAGAVLGATVAFALARAFVGRVSARIPAASVRRLDEVLTRNGLAAIVGLRLLLTGSVLLNFGSGLTSMRARDYVVGTAVGLAPKVFVAAYLFALVREPDIWTALASGPTATLLVLFIATKVIGAALLLWTLYSVRRAAPA